MGDSEIFLRQLVHLDALFLSPTNFELRITKSQIFLKAIVNSFKTLFDTSPPRIMGYEVLLLCFNMRSHLLDDIVRDREHPIAIGEDVGWIHFLSRDVHKCNKLFLDSNKEGILSIALLEFFRITQIALHCPCHESSSLIFHQMGCRHYFVVDRVEVLVDECDSRSSSRVREH